MKTFLSRVKGHEGLLDLNSNTNGTEQSNKYIACARRNISHCWKVRKGVGCYKQFELPQISFEDVYTDLY